MFGQEAAACCDSGAVKNAAISLPATTVLAPAGRDVAFPMDDPFGPVNKARIPVPGLNRFPGRYNRMGRRYYGLKGGAGLRNSSRFRGMGLLPPMINVDFGSGALSTPPFNPQEDDGGGGGFESIINSIRGLLPSVPAIISAARGKPYYNPAQLQQQQTVYGQPVYTSAQTGQAGASIGAQTGAAVGNIGDTIGNIVAQHPYLTLAAVGGAILLFMRPPGRR